MHLFVSCLICLAAGAVGLGLGIALNKLAEARGWTGLAP